MLTKRELELLSGIVTTEEPVSILPPDFVQEELRNEDR